MQQTISVQHLKLFVIKNSILTEMIVLQRLRKIFCKKQQIKQLLKLYATRNRFYKIFHKNSKTSTTSNCPKNSPKFPRISHIPLKISIKYQLTTAHPMHDHPGLTSSPSLPLRQLLRPPKFRGVLCICARVLSTRRRRRRRRPWHRGNYQASAASGATFISMRMDGRVRRRRGEFSKGSLRREVG